MNGTSTRRYTTTTDEPVSDAAGATAVEPLAESIIYVCALIADRPRAIDRYIDYFGERRPVAGKARANSPSSPVAAGPAVSNRYTTAHIGRAVARLLDRRHDQ